MAWDAARSRGDAAGRRPEPDLTGAQIDARRRFEPCDRQRGPGLSDILWRIVCAGEGMREAETALGWPARAGKLVLTLALDRIADYYRHPLSPCGPGDDRLAPSRGMHAPVLRRLGLCSIRSRTVGS